MYINNKMYILALVSIIFLPLTFATGLLGSNVGGIPGANHHFGFLFMCLILLLIAGVTLVILKLKKWI